MLEFIVTGRIPGTTLQIDLATIVSFALLLLALVVIRSYFHSAHRKNHTTDNQDMRYDELVSL